MKYRGQRVCSRAQEIRIDHQKRVAVNLLGPQRGCSVEEGNNSSSKGGRIAMLTNLAKHSSRNGFVGRDQDRKLELPLST